VDETEEFVERLGTEPKRTGNKMEGVSPQQQPPPALTADTPSSKLWADSVQWAALANDSYIACGRTVPTLPAGVYRIESQRDDWKFIRTKLLTDTLLQLPDSASKRVLEGISAFWAARDRFRKRGQLFKRGVLMWGPPGGGKTALVSLLTAELVEAGGIVLLSEVPHAMSEALRDLRRIEADRPIICVHEDLDEICQRHGESAVLSLLDGENQVDNIVHLATTNYPEALDPRLVNRPSRFDEVIKIGMPSSAARDVYIRSRVEVPAELSEDELSRWVTDTAEMSIAHLRELVIAVFCLGRTYEETIKRLGAMKKAPNSRNYRQPIGLTGGEPAETGRPAYGDTIN
jgi:hypothetical protein